MKQDTNISFTFTAEARAKRQQERPGETRSIANNANVLPIQGDAVRFGWQPDLWFVVNERQFEYTGDGTVNVEILLGLPSRPDPVPAGT